MDVKTLMRKSRGLEPAELVLKNARIINVYSGAIEQGDIAIEAGIIIGIGDYHGHKEKDMQNHYVAPGFIDGHVHIESSMLTPPEFAKIIIPKGTTTIIADPHEIANVSGVKGIEYMLKSSTGMPLEVYMMLPSCVPATEHENNGAEITIEDIEKLKDHPGVLGLGEVMDYPAVLSGDEGVHRKIALMKHRVIDGHAPDILGRDLNAYATAGIMTDHECTHVEAMLERISRGMYVHLREGSATRNVKTLLEGVTKDNHHRLLFCTDDKHPEDILREGHINYNVNLATKAGIEPIDAIRMATLNAAQCYRLNHLGAIAPGKSADLIVFEDLYDIQPILVYKKGTVVAKYGEPCFDIEKRLPDAVTDTVHVDVSTLSFELRLKSDKVRVIGLVKSNITTTDLTRNVTVENGCFVPNENEDILKLALIERHRNTGNIGLGLVEGFGFKNGAIAMTIAHDSHNLIVVGSDDASMRTAVETLVEIQGGIVLVKDGKLIEKLQLEVAGIMTDKPATSVQEALERMVRELREMGLNETIDDPFTSLAFLSLPVIPKLKLTDRGLFDVESFSLVDIEVKD